MHSHSIGSGVVVVDSVVDDSALSLGLPGVEVETGVIVGGSPDTADEDDIWVVVTPISVGMVEVVLRNGRKGILDAAC